MIRRRLSGWLIVGLVGCQAATTPPSPSSSAATPISPIPPAATSVTVPADSTPTSDAPTIDSPRFAALPRDRFPAFVYENGRDARALMVQSTGGGAGWVDYDRDGRIDLMLVQGGLPAAPTGYEQPSDRLYRQTDALMFRDVTELAGAGDAAFGQGVAVADYNDDGFDDVYVTNFGENRLLLNLGDGTFADVSRSSGTNDPLWSTSAAWFDLDDDGLLDLYVCNYLKYDVANPHPCPAADGTPSVCDPNVLDPLPDTCFRNLGDGTFAEVAQAWGLVGAGSKSLGVVAADLVGDRTPEIYVGNDATANFLFVKQPDGRFTDEAVALGAAANGRGLFQASMGIACSDYDHDGRLDLYATHFSFDYNTLYRNLGPEGFADVTGRVDLVKPTYPYVAFGVMMHDFNADGREDIVVGNGHVDDWSTRGSMYQMPAQCFSFDGKRWVEQTLRAGDYFQLARLTRAVAAADVDGDGDLDLAFVNQGDPAELLVNESNDGNLLAMSFIGRKNNRRGVGVRVTLQQDGRSLYQQLIGGGSYCSAHEPLLGFGLGTSDSPCSLDVEWPDGRQQRFENVAVDQALIIDEARGIVQSRRLERRSSAPSTEPPER